jgi:hypothetical protein
VGLLEDIGRAVGKAFGSLVKAIQDLLRFKPEMLKDIRAEIAVRSIDENMFKTDEVKEFVRQLKEKMKGSPETVSDWFRDTFGELLGKMYDTLIGVVTPAERLSFEDARKQAGVVTAFAFDVVLLIGILDVIATAFSATLVRNLVHIGRLFMGTFALDSFVDAVVAPAATPSLVKPLQYGFNARYRTGLPSETVVREAYLRGLIGEDAVDDFYAKHGLPDEWIDKVKELYWIIPSPSDLIRMAVREVFTPEIVAKFGQMEDFPEDFARWARKVGLSEEWARNYWAAHWELPSATQGFEMFHRGIISYDELKTLLRALDVMPFWRDKLIQIAYSVPTRVDVRRMYALGVIDREVKKYYQWMGYTPEDAERLTKFTEKTGGRTMLRRERELTKSEITRLYRLGQIGRDDAMEMLQDLGYTPDAADYILDLAEYQAGDEPKQLNTSHILQSYRYGLIARDEAKAELLDIGWTDKAAERLLQLEDVKLKAKRFERPRERDLTPTQVIKAYQKELISAEELIDYLLFLGYDEWEIKVLLGIYEVA